MYLLRKRAVRRKNLRLNDNLVYLITFNPKPTMMKKNLLGAIVIFFVTLAFLLMIDDITKSKNPQQQNTVDVYDANQQPDLVITDEVE